MERLSHNHADDTSELLSAYIDNAVDVTERRRAESLTRTCPACAQELQELRMFKALLRDLPNVAPPRSFTLDPATAVGPRRLIFPTLRWATLAATALLLLVLGADVLSSSGGSPTSSTAAFAPQAASASQQAGQELNTFRVPAGGGATGGGAAATGAQPEAAPPAPDQSEAARAAAGTTAEQPQASAATGERAAMAAQAASPAGSEQPASEIAPSAANQPGALASIPFASSEAADASLPPAAGAAGAQQKAAPSLASQAAVPQDTVSAQQTRRPASGSGSWLTTLRLAEIALALIAVAFSIAALWTWRRGI